MSKAERPEVTPSYTSKELAMQGRSPWMKTPLEFKAATQPKTLPAFPTAAELAMAGKSAVTRKNASNDAPKSAPVEVQLTLPLDAPAVEVKVAGKKSSNRKATPVIVSVNHEANDRPVIYVANKSNHVVGKVIVPEQSEKAPRAKSSSRVRTAKAAAPQVAEQAAPVAELPIAEPATVIAPIVEAPVAGGQEDVSSAPTTTETTPIPLTPSSDAPLAGETGSLGSTEMTITNNLAEPTSTGAGHEGISDSATTGSVSGETSEPVALPSGEAAESTTSDAREPHTDLVDDASRAEEPTAEGAPASGGAIITTPEQLENARRAQQERIQGSRDERNAKRSRTQRFGQILRNNKGKLTAAALIAIGIGVAALLSRGPLSSKDVAAQNNATPTAASTSTETPVSAAEASPTAEAQAKALVTPTALAKERFMPDFGDRQRFISPNGEKIKSAWDVKNEIVGEAGKDNGNKYLQEALRRLGRHDFDKIDETDPRNGRTTIAQLPEFLNARHHFDNKAETQEQFAKDLKTKVFGMYAKDADATDPKTGLHISKVRFTDGKTFFMLPDGEVRNINAGDEVNVIWINGDPIVLYGECINPLFPLPETPATATPVPARPAAPRPAAPIATATPIPSAPTATPAPSWTATPTVTVTNTAIPTNTPVPSTPGQPTNTPVPNTPTNTPVATSTFTVTPVEVTYTPTTVPSPTYTVGPGTPTPTELPTNTPTTVPSATPTVPAPFTPTVPATPTLAPSQVPQATPTQPAETATPIPPHTPVVTPTAIHQGSPTPPPPTPAPSQVPQATPTQPASTATAIPAHTPGVTPTAIHAAPTPPPAPTQPLVPTQAPTQVPQPTAVQPAATQPPVVAHTPASTPAPIGTPRH